MESSGELYFCASWRSSREGKEKIGFSKAVGFNTREAAAEARERTELVYQFRRA